MTSTSLTSLDHLLKTWSREPTIAGNVVEWHTDPARPAELEDLPWDLHPSLKAFLREKDIRGVYTHQAQSWKSIRQGHHAVIVTGTASGKTLCYNLPVLNHALQDPDARALFLFPTKALTQDQFQGLREESRFLADALAASFPGPAVYDGDTPTADRPGIRQKARMVLTNPDMLHTGILPHHTLWAEFFRNLRFVIIDEIHVYRGVFGSHVANVLRRLKRVAHFYGASLQFILTSATIGNPGALAERLIEEPVSVIDHDGSPRGLRHFLLYNPPLVNQELGIRASASSEIIRLVNDLLDQEVQSLLFARARRTVELMLRNLINQRGDHENGTLRSYRSGYLPRERREIEFALRTGQARAVVATNALELGIDIGGMDAVLLVGYPGTIASTRQQAGRAGRKQGSALAVLVASANPLDQYLMQHPEFIFERSPEQALINPDNLLILLQHLRCAAFELPFKPGEGFGRLPRATLDSFLDFMTQTGELHASNDSFYWMADRYPADAVSLRSSSPMKFALQSDGPVGPAVIGDVDYESAMWMVHPQAIYLHAGQTYEVDSLDLEQKVAHLRHVDVDYYTEPKRQVEIEKISVMNESDTTGGSISFGEILVTTTVVGFRRLKWYTNENLGDGELELPPTQLRTTGYWLTLSDQTVDSLRSAGSWNNDPNQYGPNWPMQRKLALLRDSRTCQVCGLVESNTPFHVHHKVPFRNFTTYSLANQLDNLVTLCPTCHHQAETSVKMKSGLSGLAYVLHNLAPLFLMCDVGDLGSQSDPLSPLADKKPAVVLYDMVPAGIGLAETLFDLHHELMHRAHELVAACPCPTGCPSCVGPAGPNGIGGKEETLALLNCLI